MLYRFLRGISYTSIKIWAFSLILVSFSSTPPKSTPWGFTGHKKINELAVFTLPPEMVVFYKKHVDYLVENSVLPDKRRYIIKDEGPKHYIDLDHYQLDSLEMEKWVPRTWKDAVLKYGRDSLFAYGVLPWNLQWMLHKLTKAFEKKDAQLILKYSAEIGHYVADAHVPLHTTENYNGQLTNQHGIHGLWESRLVELNWKSYDFFVGKAQYLNAPLDETWKIIFKSHSYLDQVFQFEKIASDSVGLSKKYAFEQRGTSIVKVYSQEFSQLYHEIMDDMVQKRMRASVRSVGSFWFTAWVNAGQPDLRALEGDKKQMMLETKDSLETYQDKAVSIKRSHEH